MPASGQRSPALERGLAAYAAGRVDEARAAFEAALRLHPTDAEALFMRGTLRLQAGEAAAAVDDLAAATQVAPGFAKGWNNLGIALGAAGRSGEACAAFERALSIAPDYAEAAYNLGNRLAAAGDLQGAQAAQRRALAARPGYAAARRELGAALVGLGRPAEGVAELTAATGEAPDDPDGWLALGNGLRAAGRPVDGEAAYRRALALRPDWAAALNNLGAALADQGRIEKAAGFYERAVARRPEYPEAWANLADALRELGRQVAAEAAGRRAVALARGDANAWLALGNALQDRGRSADAAAAYTRAVQAAPGLAAAHANLGAMRRALGDPAGAEAACTEALALDPAHRMAQANRVEALMHLCAWDALDGAARRLDELVDEARADGRDDVGESPFLSVIRCADPARNLAVAAARSRRIARRVAGRTLERRPAGGPGPGGALCVGYLSADFHGHATAHLIGGLFALHDRARVVVRAYSYGPDDGGPHRRRIEAGCDAFVDVTGLDPAAAAQRIHDDGVDILVDLKGHTEGSRLEICALRPCPVQVTWLGFPGSTGAAFFDYALVDPIVAPPGSDADWSERLVRLPGSYQVNDHAQPVTPAGTRRDHGLPEEAFVFCSFNQPYKVERAAWALWMGLLRSTPGAVLWLLAGVPAAHEALRREAAARGVDGGRIVFAPPIDKPLHLGRLSLADLALDTFTVGGHTTTSDALWAGVPVVTCLGRHFAGRVAASLLTAAGLPDFVAPTPAAYAEMAARLAASAGALADARARLRQRERSSLFDTNAFARKLESAYAIMWARQARGEAPAAFDVSDVPS